MPNRFNWRERRDSIPEGNVACTVRVQMENGNYAKTAGTRQRIAGRQGFSGQI